MLDPADLCTPQRVFPIQDANKPGCCCETLLLSANDTFHAWTIGVMTMGASSKVSTGRIQHLVSEDHVANNLSNMTAGKRRFMYFTASYHY